MKHYSTPLQIYFFTVSKPSVKFSFQVTSHMFSFKLKRLREQRKGSTCDMLKSFLGKKLTYPPSYSI